MHHWRKRKSFLGGSTQPVSHTIHCCVQLVLGPDHSVFLYHLINKQNFTLCTQQIMPAISFLEEIVVTLRCYARHVAWCFRFKMSTVYSDNCANWQQKHSSSSTKYNCNSALAHTATMSVRRMLLFTAIIFTVIKTALLFHLCIEFIFVIWFTYYKVTINSLVTPTFRLLAMR
jgi:hypothetical protein